ncbi:MAG: hypothetical protein E7Z85_04665 [Methanosphaera stadtmanae]|nr:hypothetical protein [Methanosphaera stadtmanae]
MKQCTNCNSLNEDHANNCIQCGTPFNKNFNSLEYQNNNVEVHRFENEQIQTYNNQEMQIPQQNYQQFNNQNQYQQFQNNVPQNKKSKVVGLILNMLVVGLGYAYVGKWGEGIVLLVLYLLMFILGFLLLVPWIIALGLWIYSLFKTNNMIDKYNQGIPY